MNTCAMRTCTSVMIDRIRPLRITFLSSENTKKITTFPSLFSTAFYDKKTNIYNFVYDYMKSLCSELSK